MGYYYCCSWLGATTAFPRLFATGIPVSYSHACLQFVVGKYERVDFNKKSQSTKEFTLDEERQVSAPLSVFRASTHRYASGAHAS